MERLYELEQELLNTIKKLENAPDTLADAISDYENLDEAKKTVLADLFNKADPTLSDKKREMIALADPIYAAHLEALGLANKERIRVRHKYEIMMAKLDVLRSVYAAEKEKLKLT